ncbi:MAG: hypothetical protein QM775_03895 [Pirellulales bacterium]
MAHADRRRQGGPPRPRSAHVHAPADPLKFVRITHLGNHWPSIRELRILGEGTLPPRPKTTAIAPAVEHARRSRTAQNR